MRRSAEPVARSSRRVPGGPRRRGGGPLLLLLVIAGVLGVDARPVEAQLLASGVARGPFQSMERSPVYRASHTPSAQPGEVTSAGRVEVGFATTYSNIFEWVDRPGLQHWLDTERWINQVDLRWGVAEGWEAGARLSTRTDWGGFLDGLIQWWHHRLGLPNGDREQVDDYLFNASIEREGEAIFEQTSGTRLEDPVVFVGRQLFASPERSLALRASAKLPVGSSGTHSGNADVSVQLDGRRSWTRWHAYAGLGWTTVRLQPSLEPFSTGGAWVGHLSVERETGPIDVQLQFQGGSAYLEGVGDRELDRFPLNFGVGASFDLAGWRWEAVFVEDIRPNSPSVDFTLDIRLRRAFGG